MWRIARRSRTARPHLPSYSRECVLLTGLAWLPVRGRKPLGLAEVDSRSAPGSWKQKHREPVGLAWRAHQLLSEAPLIEASAAQRAGRARERHRRAPPALGAQGIRHRSARQPIELVSAAAVNQIPPVNLTSGRVNKRVRLLSSLARWHGRRLLYRRISDPAYPRIVVVARVSTGAGLGLVGAAPHSLSPVTIATLQRPDSERL